MNLGNVAHVRTGLVLSRKQSLSPGGGILYKVLTLSSFGSGGDINRDRISSFNSEQIIDDEYITKLGDVIIRLSTPNTAVHIDERHEGLVIPSQFSIIRNLDASLMPEYLGAYLNSAYVKSHTIKGISGSVISTISTQELKNIDVPIIDIANQRIIIKINRLKNSKFLLMDRLKTLEDKKINYFVERQFKGE